MPAFLPADRMLEGRIQEIGHQLLTRMDAAPASGIFSTKGVASRLMEWSLKNPGLKVQLFRFVDVLPTLTSNADVVGHFQEYLGDRAVELNPAFKAGLAAASFAPGLLASSIRANVLSLAHQFVTGETPDDLLRQLRQNARQGIATTIDLLGETVLSEREADTFLRRNLEVLDTVSAALAGEPQPCDSDIGPTGPLPRLNLSVKISALAPQLHPADPETALRRLKERLRPILERAAEVGAFINIDMESYSLKDLTLTLFKSMLEEPAFAEKPAAGIALQAYLRDSERDLQELVAWSRRRGRPITIRLVKGAYWDVEDIQARQRNWPVPVWSEKPETDASFEALSRILLENNDVVTPAFATHNVRSCAHAIAHAERLKLHPRTCEFQALYGMADDLKLALVEMKQRVREYCTIGALLPGMAYLVRRLLENTSNEGFLQRRNVGDATARELLANPVGLIATEERIRKGQNPPRAALHAPVDPRREFRNVPGTDFTQATSRERQRDALARLESSLSRDWPLVIGNRKVTGDTLVPSVNPARPEQVLGRWTRASIANAETALASARQAFPHWRATPVAERAALLERTADLMAARRFELNALEILEAGKPWLEADADVSEAIDFCRFYASEMRRLDRGTVTQSVPGERCIQRWTPRGTGVVIAPWNFPLAILCGMTVAPVVAGNTVIIKPAEQTSLLGAALMDLFVAAGVPPGVITLLTGYGDDVGAHLVGHSQVDFVAFTGSRSVGLKIWETAGRTLPGQVNLKKAVCEMGGKNALIIDSDADPDEAIPAALYSAFGFSGQKCSALSRLIVLDDIHDAFVDRLIAAADALPIGLPSEPGTIVGPVIDADAQTKILNLIETGKREATLRWQASLPPTLAAGSGYFVAPAIFTDVPSDAVIAREEMFGPVLAILKARDLDEAFALANASEYALTGGLFSRRPSALARAERELQVGNVYLNRGITGAIVQRHPFGGYRMSGSGTKAGGPDYLENFLFPRAIAENVVRRGFTPPESGE